MPQYYVWGKIGIAGEMIAYIFILTWRASLLLHTAVDHQTFNGATFVHQKSFLNFSQKQKLFLFLHINAGAPLSFQLLLFSCGEKNFQQSTKAAADGLAGGGADPLTSCVSVVDLGRLASKIFFRYSSSVINAAPTSIFLRLVVLVGLCLSLS